MPPPVVPAPMTPTLRMGRTRRPRSPTSCCRSPPASSGRRCASASSHGAEAYSEARQRERDVTPCQTGQLMPAGRPRTGGALRSLRRSEPGRGSGSIRRRGCWSAATNDVIDRRGFLGGRFPDLRSATRSARARREFANPSGGVMATRRNANGAGEASVSPAPSASARETLDASGRENFPASTRISTDSGLDRGSGRPILRQRLSGGARVLHHFDFSYACVRHVEMAEGHLLRPSP